MRVSDLIRSTLDLIDRNSEEQEAGAVGDLHPAEFANAPGEHISDIQSVLAAGNDLNKPKHPSDMRSDSISMYPNYQAKE